MGGTFGAFGKIPALGDFFRLNVSQAFVAAWDPWMQQAMVTARARLAAAWQDRYMSAPIWRFSLARGLAGPEPVIGVVMPSVDRVGRLFPLTLVGPAPADAALRTLVLQETLLSALELLALDALDDAMTRDELERRLGALTVEPRLPDSRSRRIDGGVALASADAAALLPDLIWSVGGNPKSVFTATVEGNARMLAGRGLPDTGDATALFDINAPLWSGDG
jgi:type VI secretion system protein ImpM